MLRSPRPPPPPPRLEGLGQALVDLARVFIAMGEAIAGRGGVTAQQWAVLHQVATAGEAGLAPSALATLNQTSRANVTKLVARLGRAGLLAALPSPVDGRGKRLALTVMGQRVLLAMNTEKAARLARVLSAFSPAEQAALERLAGKLLRGLGAPAPPRRP